MKLIERFFAHSARKQARQRRRHLEDKSLDPRGAGWLIDKSDPNTLYLLGYSLTLNPEDPRHYSPDYLEKQYIALKSCLVRMYPGFTPTKVKLEVEALYAATLAADADLMARAVPRLRTYRLLDDWSKEIQKLDGLDIPVVLDGDEVVLSISRGSYFEGYGFFVYDHPESRDGVGMWCRVTPDILATLSSEKTL